MCKTMKALEFVINDEIYREVILSRIPKAQKFLWIATADIKDLYVEKNTRFVPFLETLSDLVTQNVSVRLMHAKEPGPAFRKDFDNYPNLIEGIERILCPRVHFKTIVVDGMVAYMGSANLTGAGVGAKSSENRNFENGIITTDSELIENIMDQFDSVWRGDWCESCGRKKFCADYADVSFGEGNTPQ